MKDRTALFWVAGLLLLGVLGPAVGQNALPALEDAFGLADRSQPDAPAKESAADDLVLKDEAGQPIRPTTSGLAPALKKQAPPTPKPAPLVPSSTPVEPRIPTSSPAGRFIEAVVSTPNIRSAQLLPLVQQYWRESGFNVASDLQGDFDENSTATFTHEIGDITGDGYEDMALDVYCVEYTCDLYPSILRPDEYVSYYLGSACPPPHVVIAVDGKNGTHVWDTQLNYPAAMSPFIGCSIQLVAGTVPLDNGTRGILVYRYTVEDPTLLGGMSKINNEFFVLNPFNGARLWSQSFDGFLTGAILLGNGHVAAENLLINPIIMAPPTKGVNILPGFANGSLYLQAVGFNYTSVNSAFALPGFSDSFRFVDSYQPNEWAARIDYATGRIHWRQHTFQPDTRRLNVVGDTPIPYRSVFPNIIIVDPLPPQPLDSFTSRFAPDLVSQTYWQHQPCCFDNTGDGIPDIMYTTLEWSAFPHTDYFGPYFTSSYISLFDGATGRSVYHMMTENGTDECLPCFVSWTETLGDVNGDGAHDVLLHQMYFNWDYFHNVTIRDGKTGMQIWRQDSRRDQFALVLGDVDKDGGNDFLLFDALRSGWGYTNVTRTPLSVISGRDGHVLLETSSFIAPVDLLMMVQLILHNGRPDVDGDGVTDFIVDDPVYLSDLTTVHRLSMMSPVTGKAVYSYADVGAFTFPCDAGDVTGDGIDDLGVLNGDVLDLWFTLRDGANGSAIWSRRVMAPRQSNYVQSIPNVACHSLEHVDERTQTAQPSDLVLNLQMQIIGLGGYYYSAPTYKQIMKLDGDEGNASWSTPSLWDPDLNVIVEGAAPLSNLFANASRPHAVGFAAAVERDPFPVGVGAAVFGVATVTTYAAVAFGRRIWK